MNPTADRGERPEVSSSPTEASGATAPPPAGNPLRPQHPDDVERARAHLHSLFMQAPAPIIVMRGPEHHVELVNAPYRQLVGCEVYVGRPLRETFPELESQGIFDILDGVYASGTPFEGKELPVLLRSNGEERFYNFVYQPMRGPGGNVEGIMTFAYDVTEQVRARQQQARAEERALEERETLDLLNKVGQFIAAELDSDKLVQAITDSATRLTGAQFGAFFYNVVDDRGESYTLFTISGAPREAFAKFPMPRNTKVFAPTFSGEGVVRVPNIRKDPRYGHSAPYHGMPSGHLPVVSYLAVPVVSRDGRVIGGLFFGHGKEDVFTERSERLAVGVAAQAAIAMDNARLYREAQRLIRALERTNQDLDQFAYVTSHDLKAPLRGIANLSQWLEEDMGAGLSADSRKHLDLMRRRVHRMEALIDGILQYSRAGRVRGRPEALEVGRVLQELVELVAPRPPAVVEFPGELPALFTERVPLQQVLMNLITNALKHARREDARVVVSAVEEGELCHFTVTDNGAGIAPEFHERIWGIFQTLEARDKVEGTGIGLAVVKKIVESRGGKAWVESAAGAGAKFHFTWPMKERAA